MARFAPPGPRCAVTLGLLAALTGAPARADDGSVRFGTEVMAVLSKAGCNAGACHGNLNGKGGFKLSLRGEDAAFDYLALTRDNLGRRIDPLRSADSLILQKATAAVPHEGGRRFGPNSVEHELLARWIAAGAPPDPAGPAPRLDRIEVVPGEQIVVEPAGSVKLSVRAVYADGRRRDVTRLAVFDPANPQVAAVEPGGLVRRLDAGESTVLVRFLDRQATARVAFVPARPGFRWPGPPENNLVDRHVFAKLRALRVLPSDLSSDTVFLRRVYLDAIGVLPTVEETRAFLADRRPDRREQLIDALLRRPEFADFWALKWSDLLRNEEKALDRKGMQAFHGWVRDRIAAGQPLNEFARDLIAARGSTYADPAANYYRALRDPQTRAEATAQVFLGVRLQCARCHNHPFERWTQDDYHALSAFFARVRYREVENNRKDRLDKHEFVGEQVVWIDREGELPHPRTGEPLVPRLLGCPTPALPADGDRLRALADWVADPANPFFARTQVNRVWYHLLGRGIVDPDDDFRASNPPSNPALLEALTRDFVEHSFDLRHLVRTILTSRTYQLSATPTDGNRDDETNFARAAIQPLKAEPLLDGLAQVFEVPVRFNGYPPGIRAGQIPGVLGTFARGGSLQSERFLKTFGKPDRLLSCDCERSDDTTLLQSFQLITGELVHSLIAEKDNRLGLLLAAGKSDRDILEEFYLAALCRPPSAAELEKTLGYVGRAKDRRAALEDVVWGLVNAKEFLLRR
jgi:hypothetical protein